MADPRWLEVSLVVDGELAEALADLMSRYVEGGVVVESGVKFDSIEDEGTAGGPVRVFGYIPVDDQLDVTREKLERGLWHMGQIQPLPQLVYRPIEDLEEGKRTFIKYFNFLLPLVLVAVVGIWRTQRNRNIRIRRMQEKYS